MKYKKFAGQIVSQNITKKIPENLSFQTALGTLLKVITPLTVSFKSFHVELKSTRFGFNDILSQIPFYVFFCEKTTWIKAKFFLRILKHVVNSLSASDDFEII